MASPIHLDVAQEDNAQRLFRKRTGLSLLLAYGPPALIDLSGLSDFLFDMAILAAIWALIYLTAITVGRLRILGQSTWWALLMVPAFSFGPVLFEARHGGAHLILTAGSLLGFLPVLACCVLRTPEAVVAN